MCVGELPYSKPDWLELFAPIRNKVGMLLLDRYSTQLSDGDDAFAPLDTHNITEKPGKSL
jgi:hypothetical protein